MSTRCQIAIYGENIQNKLDNTDYLFNDWQVLLYRHCDGYPESVVPDIMPLLEQFMEKRGHDPEYLGACLIAWLKHKNEGGGDDLHEISIGDFKIDLLHEGISKAVHWDIRFFYAIDDKNLYVFNVYFDEKEKEKLDLKLKLINTYPINQTQEKTK